MAERTAWRSCADNRSWSVFGKKKRGENSKVGPPVRDDLVGRDFTADAPKRLWLAGITEYSTGERKLYLITDRTFESDDWSVPWAATTWLVP